MAAGAGLLSPASFTPQEGFLYLDTSLSVEPVVRSSASGQVHSIPQIHHQGQQWQDGPLLHVECVRAHELQGSVWSCQGL